MRDLMNAFAEKFYLNEQGIRRTIDEQARWDAYKKGLLHEVLQAQLLRLSSASSAYAQRSSTTRSGRSDATRGCNQTSTRGWLTKGQPNFESGHLG